jgi:DNA-binding GntR family transcriptional regulator
MRLELHGPSQNSTPQEAESSPTPKPGLPDASAAAEAVGSSAIDRSGLATIHGQVSTRIRDLITSGEWPDHYRLPAEPALATNLRVARGTLRRAVATLVEEGLLVRTRGRGTFVRSGTPEETIAQELLTVSESMERLGISYRTDVLEQAKVPVGARVGALLCLPEGTDVLRLVRRRSIKGSWVALFVNVVRLDYCPGIERVDFTSRKLFDVIESDFGLEIAVGRRTFEARLAAGEVSRLLEIPESTPVLYLEQLTYLASSDPIEYSDVWIVGGQLRLGALLRRDNKSRRRLA